MGDHDHDHDHGDHDHDHGDGHDHGHDHGAQKPCPHCGEQIKASAQKCLHCGEWLDAGAQQAQRAGGEPPMNVMAIISLISGVLGLTTCCCIFFAPLPLISIVMGIVSLNQFKTDPNQKGKVMAQIGIAISIVTILLFVVLLVLQLTGVITPPQYGGQGGGFGDFQPR